MATSYILTFIGDDRPGLVEALSNVVEANGGNWHESHLSQLGGKFAGLVLITLPELPEGRAAALEKEMKALAASGLSVRVTPTSEAAPAADGRRVVLTVIGPDRAGIVHEVSSALARRQINVLEMESRVESAPMSAELLFNARIEAQVPEHTDFDDLHVALEEIANQMTLDIDLD